MAGVIIGDQAYVYCDDCGKPLTISNEFGMFCDDLCGFEESKQIGMTIDSLIESALKVGFNP
jgi:hypothetical protein